MIEIKNLTKKYGNQIIFSHTDWSTPSHGIVCILGASGCGKSTLLNMIAGFDSDYSGEINVAGIPISKMNKQELCTYRRDFIGFVFQNHHLLTGYTVLENILLGCSSDCSDAANVLLVKLGIYDKANELIENLSGGQKQRVAIARALIKDPAIILADEPTGALDRNNANEIMKLLKEIAKDRLVVIITHDKKIGEYADCITTIEDKKMQGTHLGHTTTYVPRSKASNPIKVSYLRHAFKNLKIHFWRYFSVSIAISIGIIIFILSLSSGNSMQHSIQEFKDKNVAYNNGYIKTDTTSDNTFALLKKDPRIKEVYRQYSIQDISLSINGKVEQMAEKYPMPKATETMSYGHMPKNKEKQIALSPSLAKKFDSTIHYLIGKEVTLKHKEKTYSLTISGIFNAQYDDFFVSLDIEQALYQTGDQENPYAISYDVHTFEDITTIHQMLQDKGVKAETAVDEVRALQNTFANLTTLFLIISIFILLISVLLSSILLVKLQNSRHREFGLLAALGYHKKHIKGIIIMESMLLSGLSSLLCAILAIDGYITLLFLPFSITITMTQMLVAILITAISIMIIAVLSSHKILKMDPALALRQ